MASFKEQFTLQQRIEQANRIKQKYSDRIPRPASPRQSSPAVTRTMGEIYKEHQDEDGFLYMIYANDEVYGGCEQQQDK
ncbi:hypothetical protein PTSG_03077 [Salpingoeca rosetta]|uniref:Autophagy-related protein n=1 Tax=Salpingoeca rosetta (strain ATCC 50818 / BSB-021) TaxID=946362 RepID=F2U466_SALR5|nr:uncharacterized protein PTSG_03077 [Salpingoeca rosetta]EGD82432.1 hypothetical protein PTSG_03077 [Salpingoeca rosetta]|eukprot:XP_004995668.1 hypothetical protein PTSG_03077 [Salpingoeca rosetta]